MNGFCSRSVHECYVTGLYLVAQLEPLKESLISYAVCSPSFLPEKSPFARRCQSCGNNYSLFLLVGSTPQTLLPTPYNSDPGG